MLRIGYFRASDESVSSSTWDGNDRLTWNHIRLLLKDPDISDVWVRPLDSEYLTVLKETS